MAQGPGNGDGPIGPTGIVKELTIYINARSVRWDKPTISFAQVVEQWNKLDPARHVIGDLPGIDWTAKDGRKGIFYPSDKPMPVVDELSFTIDDSYLA
ncbi:MAG: hypothetical protein OXE96_10565 [Gemmatimonadetes bacterium]|nr:hypothetical protein [Gemmatimonadota bacterium]